MEEALVDSHHDIIVTSFALLSDLKNKSDERKNISAPRIDNTRVKIKWSEEGIRMYEQIVSAQLSSLRETWSETSSKSIYSVLLQSTNQVLNHAARITNKAYVLGKKWMPKSRKKPRDVIKAENLLNKSHRLLKKAQNSPLSTGKQLDDAKEYHSEMRAAYRRLLRSLNLQENIKRDAKFNTITSNNPSPAHKFLRSVRTCASSAVQNLTVNNKEYIGEHVPDGFFDSLSTLKTIDVSAHLENFKDLRLDYENIVKICSSGPKIPQISLIQSTEILCDLRGQVNDLYSVTANHYVNAGHAGFVQFNHMLNVIISELNIVSLPEINSVYAIILYKGHNKDKTSDRSYRSISVCPLIAKGMDSYIRLLNIEKWNSAKASTQFQGEGSSHELSALLLTEVIQHSLHVSKKPMYALYLDARSAYDRAVRQLLIRNLYFSGTTGQELIFINERLQHRQTYCEWDKNLMGPIDDTLGVEQGGVNSDSFYKLLNNEQLLVSQESELGVTMGDITISAIGQADDVVLTSNNPYSLFNLLYLTKEYCSKYMVELVQDKTKLQVFLPSSLTPFANYFKTSPLLSIDHNCLTFTDTAEHVGIIRSTTGNLPNLLDRIQSQKKALGAVLPAGLAKAHRANPAASIRANTLHGVPVLMSGLSSLVLKQTEISMISQQHKKTLQNLQKLHEGTPEAVIFFLSGTLPGKAILHLRQLSLLSMISHLDGSPIHQHAQRTFNTAKASSMSWFVQVRDICLLYGLPHPISILDDPIKKSRFKKQAKLAVQDYWQQRLRADAAPLESLAYFNPVYMSLSQPHPVWLTASSNPYEVNKAIIQAQMLSGRYRTESLCRYWSANPGGFCLLKLCLNTKEDLTHILITCPALDNTRSRLVSFFKQYAVKNNVIHNMVTTFLESTDLAYRTQFLLDCSTIPEIILLKQNHGFYILNHLFYLSRSWCYSIHRERLRQLGKWNLS